MIHFAHIKSKRSIQNNMMVVRYLIDAALKVALLFVIAALGGLVCGTGAYSLNKRPVQNNRPIAFQYVESLKTLAPGVDLWEGPVLYFKPGSVPLHLILIEKASQELSLYHYDGAYKLIKRYRCVTGQRHGKKQQEKDKKTPEGIFFNTKTFRDNKITIFGNRAFGLNYPDIFDVFEGNGGSGIFIHGTNRALDSYSSNGCLVMRNSEIKELDNRIDFRLTPVIIGERLPYTFASPKRNFAELTPFLKNAMLPKKYAGRIAEISSLVILGMQERVVVLGDVIINKTAGSKNIRGYSKLYMAEPGASFLVLIKREWREETIPITIAKAAKTRSSKDKARKTRSPKDKTRASISPIQPLEIVTPPPRPSKRPEPVPSNLLTIDKPKVVPPAKNRLTTDSRESVQPKPKPSGRPEPLPSIKPAVVEQPKVKLPTKNRLTTDSRKSVQPKPKPSGRPEPLPSIKPAVVEQSKVKPPQKDLPPLISDTIVSPVSSQPSAPEQHAAKKPAVETSEVAPSAEEQPDEEQIRTLVESWRKAWEEERLDDYMTFYHREFESKNKNRAAWKNYKKILNLRNKLIRVKIADVKLVFTKSSVYVLFRQYYRSDSFKAAGFKLLELKMDKDSWKIYREKMVKSGQVKTTLRRLKN